ncbi:ATP-dependent helicase [Fusibacter paucivorans]|uniref:ATP-dependent helicase n=1 Tax=Fusibacter paucivorans TaxID=76009 RepID=A0ABS5PUB4_9FIRM|nr:ATP-dependent helicase [Fusibacter paucivorans]
MNKADYVSSIAEILCGKDKDISCDECFKVGKSHICKNHNKCRISEKTEKQMEYVLSSINKCFYLEACPGSGKTEVVGMKAAYEINNWKQNSSGIAILTFTNEATNVISNRINEFSSKQNLYPHYVGTVSAFIHSYIVQPFAYKLKQYNSKSNDNSFRLIDKSISSNVNPWLKNYKCKINYERIGKKALSIYGNQIYYDEKSDDYILHISKFYEVPFEEYYKSEAFQNRVNQIRKQNGNNWMYGYKYCRQLIKECKDSFNKAGFANFEDMNNIALEILRNDSRIATRLSEKFPVIIVDECQDLSYVEINTLDILREYGSRLHFVGDLNQSVYEFKKVDPNCDCQRKSEPLDHEILSHFDYKKVNHSDHEYLSHLVQRFA